MEATPLNNVERSVYAASLSLLAFSMLTGVALAAWFSRMADPWSWRSVLTLLACMGGVTTSALVWRAPSRSHVLAGIGVVVASLIRVGPIADWTWVTLTLLALTTLLLIPLVHAFLLLPRN